MTDKDLARVKEMLLKGIGSSVGTDPMMIIRGWKYREPELEPTILLKSDLSYWYAFYVMGKRWPEAEPTILRDFEFSVNYAKNILRQRWPELEEKLLVNPEAYFWWILTYCKDVIKGRWKEVEPLLLEYGSPKSLYQYATQVINGRWPQAEPKLRGHPFWMPYKKHILDKFGVQDIGKDQTALRQDIDTLMDII